MHAHAFLISLYQQLYLFSSSAVTFFFIKKKKKKLEPNGITMDLKKYT